MMMSVQQQVPRATVTALEIPTESWILVASFLPAPDLLSTLSTCRTLRSQLTASPSFWKRQYEGQEPGFPGVETRYDFMLRAHVAALPQPVTWLPLQVPRAGGGGTPVHPIDGREGHLCTRLGSNRIVLTGGFSGDDSVYVRNLTVPRTTHNTWEWRELRPVVQSTPREPLCSVYGASLTALDENRAVRFGGFRGGGYRGESSQVAVLDLSDDERAVWQVVPCTVENPSQDFANVAARAYHHAVLLRNRFLIITGGMKSGGSVFHPLVLDTQTWTWLYTLHSTSAPEDYREHFPGQPSPRHGHTVINDTKRNRLVLFGGGSGSDLLRSGQDNSEVWACSIPVDVEKNYSDFTYRWVLLHGYQNPATQSCNSGQQQISKCLTPTQTLCLGRCHHSFRISPDTALLVFGGRPSTNGVLGYNLKTNCFFVVPATGPLPMPRFTFAATHLEEEGYILVHGGFSSQSNSSLDDMFLLDLATGLRRRQDLLQAASNVVAAAPVSDRDVMAYISSSPRRYLYDTIPVDMILRHILGRHGEQSNDESDDDSDYYPDESTGVHEE